MSDTSTTPPPLSRPACLNVPALEVNPRRAAHTLRVVFGSRATIIAAWCAIHCRADHNQLRYELWLAVFKQLSEADSAEAT